MTFDFDTPAERRGTDSQKWQKYAGRDVLPMWVADMDFRAAPAVVEALHRRVDQAVFGYARPVKATVDAVVGAMEARYGWRIDPSWLVWLPGLVCGLNVTVDALTQPGDEVLCLTPVYPPFIEAPKNRGRVTVRVPLVLESPAGAAGRWAIDWDALERAVTPRTRIFLLCHPHNPVARVWTAGELAQLADFCRRHQIVLCSDEIHCDLILDSSRRHVPTALAAPEANPAESRLITYMAPSKTSNPALRAQFVRATVGIVAEVNALGYAACEAAYRDGEPWRQALLAYLSGNRDRLVDFVARELPGIRIEAPIEATYLAWLNVEALGLPRPAAHFEAHGVGLSDGAMFGAAPGRNLRLNFGCTRATLDEALQRLKKALAAR